MFFHESREDSADDTSQESKGDDAFLHDKWGQSGRNSTSYIFKCIR